MELRKKHIAFAKEVNKLCTELADEEVALHAQLPKHLARVLKGKRMLLFEQLLKGISYSDSKVAVEMRSGFQLVGWVPRSGVFEEKVRPPTLHGDMLRAMADSYTHKSVSSIRSSGDVGQDLGLWGGHNE